MSIGAVWKTGSWAEDGESWAPYAWRFTDSPVPPPPNIGDIIGTDGTIDGYQFPGILTVSLTRRPVSRVKNAAIGTAGHEGDFNGSADILLEDITSKWANRFSHTNYYKKK